MKNAKIKETDLIQFYNYCKDKHSINQFREYAKRIITEARVPNKEILSKIDKMSHKQLVFAVNNFIMKGHGYGVI